MLREGGQDLDKELRRDESIHNVNAPEKRVPSRRRPGRKISGSDTEKIDLTYLERSGFVPPGSEVQKPKTSESNKSENDG